MSGTEPDAPQLLRVFWRSAMFLVLAAFFTVSAMVMRALIGGFGWEPWGLIFAAGTTLLCGALVLPLAVVVEVPEAIFQHWLPERRVARGRCPACGYDATQAAGHECPECGAALDAPVPYSVTWRTVQRCTAIAAPAWVLGCVIGLTLVVRDEYAFTVETQSRQARDGSLTAYSRTRSGVARFAALKWSVVDGYSGPAPFPQPKARR